MDSRVYKFMPADEDRLKSLENNQVYFSSIEELNDPFEFAVNFCFDEVTDDLRIASHTHNISAAENIPLAKARKNAEKLRKKLGRSFFNEQIDKTLEEHYEKNIEQLRSNHFVLSLSKVRKRDFGKRFPNPVSLMQMWGHYADGLKGICICYEFFELKKSLEILNERRITANDVDYQTNLPKAYAKTLFNDLIHSTHNTLDELSEAFCTKFVSWIYENELRLISNQHKLHTHSPQSIHSVFVPAKNLPLVKRVKDCLRRKSHRPTLYLIELKTDKYGMTIKEEDF